MKFLALAAAGEVDPAALAAVEDCLAEYFPLPVRRLPAWPHPAGAFDPSRGQYSSVELLKQAAARRPEQAAKLLAVTEADLFIPMLSFLFGQAQLGGYVAVLSFARLRQEFYGLPRDTRLFLERARKEALHEVGHAFGLIHCPLRACVMSLATGIRHLDLKQLTFCGDCLAALEENNR